MAKLAVWVGEDERGQALARSLNLPLVSSAQASSEFPYVLLYGEKGLALQQTGKQAFGPVVVDFMSGASEHRRTKGGGELLVRAIGGDKQQRPSVLDATAGLGRDSFVLASWGYPVTMLERSPVIAALLADGLQRGQQSNDAAFREVIDRMQLVPKDARQFLSQLQPVNKPEVVYVDPMFPPSKKSALVKKDMQAFHYVVGQEPEDADQLLELALQKAVYRVVVKRPLKAEYLAGEKPNHSLRGKAVRFDVYALKAYAANKSTG